MDVESEVNIARYFWSALHRVYLGEPGDFWKHKT